MDAPAPNLMALEMRLDTICSSARRSHRPRSVCGNAAFRRERLNAAWPVGLDDLTDHFREIDRLDCGCSRVAFIRPTSSSKDARFTYRSTMCWTRSRRRTSGWARLLAGHL